MKLAVGATLADGLRRVFGLAIDGMLLWLSYYGTLFALQALRA